MSNLAPLSTLAVHGADDAPEAARELLERTAKRLGMVPNMYGAMANSPGVLSTYLHGYDEFRRGSFTAVEQEVIALVISVFHSCAYCVAAHSTIADLNQMPAEVTEALRAGKPLEDARLQTLRELTTTLLATRGRPDAEDLAAFLAAGYREEQVLEIVLAIAVKTLSNYTNHLFNTPVDAAFAARSWTGPTP